MDWPLFAAMLLLSFAITIAIQSVRAIVVILRMTAEILRQAGNGHRVPTRLMPIQIAQWLKKYRRRRIVRSPLLQIVKDKWSLMEPENELHILGRAAGRRTRHALIATDAAHLRR